MRYVDSLKVQYKNRTPGNCHIREQILKRLLRLLLKADTRGEGGTGNPSKHNHLSEVYNPYTGTKCWYCNREYGFGRSIYDGRNLFRTKDHIRPKTQNGKNHIFNLISCCQDCNMLKGGKSVKGFAYYVVKDERLSRYPELAKLISIRAYKLFNKRNDIVGLRIKKDR